MAAAAAAAAAATTTAAACGGGSRMERDKEVKPEMSGVFTPTTARNVFQAARHTHTQDPITPPLI